MYEITEFRYIQARIKMKNNVNKKIKNSYKKISGKMNIATKESTIFYRLYQIRYLYSLGD